MRRRASRTARRCRPRSRRARWPRPAAPPSPGNAAGSRHSMKNGSHGRSSASVDAGAPPLDALAGGRRSRSFGDVEAEPRRRRIEIVRADGPADRPAAARTRLGDPATEGAPCAPRARRRRPSARGRRPRAERSSWPSPSRDGDPRRTARGRTARGRRGVLGASPTASRMWSSCTCGGEPRGPRRAQDEAEAPAAAPTASSDAWKSVLSILPW